MSYDAAQSAAVVESAITISQPVTRHWCPTLAPEVASFQLDDELVVHDARSGVMFVLNHTAARICALCDGSNPVASVAQALVADFGLPYGEALADVDEFIAELWRANLLTRV